MKCAKQCGTQRGETMLKGIDISYWQGTVDFTKVKNSGIEFAILRSGYRQKVDTRFLEYAAGCKAAGINVLGIYHFSYAVNEDEAKNEAAFAVKMAKKAGLDKSTYIFFDFEYDTVKKAKNAGVTLTKESCVAHTKAFCEYVAEAGYKPGIYLNIDFYKNWYTKEILSKYPIWLADYTGNPDYPCLVQQYSSKGTVDGIGGNVDMDYYFGTGVEKVSTTNTVQKVINDAVAFAVKIANDNTHGYSQKTRSLYNITNPSSFDCSSLVLTSYYYAFLQNGLTEQAEYLEKNCSYTGNMSKLTNVGFEIVAKNQTAHAKMVKGDIELNETYHTAMAVDSDTIVHARSSEGTSDTADNSGNEIRTQAWYKYSHGWDCRLRFTGKGLNLSGATASKTTTSSASTVTEGSAYMFTTETVKKGSKGNSVLLLQEILRARGFKGYDGNVLSLDKEAGANTIYALKAYQKSRGLTQDGICGSATWSDLIAL